MVIPHQVSGVALQIDLEEEIEALIEDIIDVLPEVLAALVVLVVGWLIGRALGTVAERLVDAVELDRMLLDTPLGEPLGGTEQSISNAFGTVVRWFVYALAFLAAADVLQVELLSEWIDEALSYLPALVGGLLVILIGFVVADFVGDAIESTRAATRTAYTSWFATGTRLFLYFVVLVIGLDTMGVDVEVLYVFLEPLAWGIGAAIALAVGIAFGWGGKEYVENHIGRWMGTAKDGMPSPDGGREVPDSRDTEE